MENHLILAIDRLLPQTQCQECGYPACKPYAKAIVNDGEDIGLCAPGGLEVLEGIAKLTHQDPEPLRTQVIERKRPAQVAVIDESACIGCTKCLPPCPVDAIIGAGKMAHSIITDHCTGCELCIAPCPVDCIRVEPIAEPTPEQRQNNADAARARYAARLAREAAGPDPRTSANPNAAIKTSAPAQATLESRQSLVQAALAAAKAKRTDHHE